jgi:hypothetical protein
MILISNNDPYLLIDSWAFEWNRRNKIILIINNYKPIWVQKK